MASFNQSPLSQITTEITVSIPAFQTGSSSVTLVPFKARFQADNTGSFDWQLFKASSGNQIPTTGQIWPLGIYSSVVS